MKSDNKILKLAIRKAKKNGFDSGNIDIFSIEKILFSHDFAKAFWGEQDAYETTGFFSCSGDTPLWKYHLRQMVLEEEPLKYIERFLK